MKFSQFNFLRLSSLLLIPLAIASPALAELREPAAVSGIRKTVDQMDQSSKQWLMRVTIDSCEGDGCSKRTIFLDEDQKIRKIITMGSGMPASSSQSTKSYIESYFDPDGSLVFRFLHDEIHKGQGLTSIHDERYYLRHRKLLAWKTNERWRVASDPRWLVTEIGANSAGDSEQSEERHRLKTK